METVTENNRLIAEFMGYFPQDIVNEQGWRGWWSSPNKFPNHESNQIMFDAMVFNKNWDWLMSVVERIEELGFNFQNEGRNDGMWKQLRKGGNKNMSLINISRGFNNVKEVTSGITKPNSICLVYYDNPSEKKEAIYKAVVQFIEWYNEQNKTN